MAWSTHVPDLKRRPGEKWSPVTAGLVRRAFQPAYLSVTFKREGWEPLGFKQNDRVVVMVGTGEHQGRIRLNKSPVGPCELLPRKIGRSTAGQVLLTANLGRMAGLPDRAEKAVGVEFTKLDEGYVEIVLPDWPASSEVSEVRDMSHKAVRSRLGAPR